MANVKWIRKNVENCVVLSIMVVDYHVKLV